MTLKSKLLLFALLISINTFSQERKIIGRILDSQTQKPIKDTNIIILGTTSGTVGNHLGFFELTISPKHKKLIVSHIGYKTSEILIPSEDRFKFFLEKEYILLNKLNLNGYPKKIINEFKSEEFKTKNDSDFIIAESGASFPGGMDNFYDFMGNSLKSELSQVNKQGFSITFTISESDQAIEILTSDSTESTNTAVRKIFLKMPNWTPATQNQNKINQHFTLPIINTDTHVVDSIDLKDFYTFISRTTKYPMQARRMGVEGVVYAGFQVDNLGNVINIKVLQDIGAGCGDEVTRVLTNTPTDLTKLLFIKAHVNKFILPVFFGLETSFKKQQFVANSDALLLNEITITAIGLEGQKIKLNSLILPTNKAYNSLGEALDEPKSVKRLSLINNSMQTFPSEIFKLSNLEFLDLERNELQKLPNEIDVLTKLQELYLFENQLESLPINFRNLKKLKVLSLASNQLKSFPHEIISLEKLEALDLSGNQISSLPPEIGTMKNLKFLVLQNNNISRVPQEFYLLKNLEKIYFQGNPIDPKDIELLKATFKKAKVIF